LSKLSGHAAHRKVGPGDAARGGQGQSERQPGAAGDDLLDRRLLRGHAFLSYAAHQQIAGLIVGEQLQRQRAGALHRDQSGELVAAGDQDGAARVPGSNGRTCSASRALSSTTRTLLSARTLR